MARKKLFCASSTRKQTEISLVYQSVTDSTLVPGLSPPKGLYARGGSDGASSSTSGVAAAAAENKRGSPKTLKLGGNSTGRVTRGRVRLVCILKAPAHLIAKMKEQYAIWKDSAKNANIRVSDLFVANQVFMHMQATPVIKRKPQALKPSVGFVTKVVEAPTSGQTEMRER